jgi:predicted amidohydrolase YtcJ
MPTVLFRGGRIRADFGGAVHDSLLSRDGRVVAVGVGGDVGASAGPVDETVDLGGAWVVPGLVDAHPHLLHFGLAAAGLADLSDASDHTDIVAAITTVASGRAPGEWVMATPVGEPHYFFRRGHQHLREGLLPDRLTLDRATVRHPVMIQAWSPTLPNVCALNSAGLVALGINAASPERVGDVWIEKDGAGVPTGRLFGAVNTNYNTDPFFREVLLRLPGPAPHLVEHATLQAISAHHSLGITTVYEPHAMEPRHIDVYRRLREDGRLTMRVKAVPEYQRFTRPSDHQKSMAELASTLDEALAAVDVNDEWVRVEGITVSAGGTCAQGNMPWPTTYRDVFGHDTSGRWFISHEAIEQAVEFCARQGLRLNVCAMGPAEYDVLLELVERHGVRDGIVQHGALMPLAHARRWAASSFRQTICCGFTWGKGDVYRKAFGTDAIADLNPLRRLLDEGMALAASTDWGPKNPWEQMWLAQTHLLGHSGVRNDGPDQVVTRAEALEMWTSGGAAVLDWPEIGRLRAASYADLVVVDRDPLTCDLDDLPDVAVMSTVTAGHAM